MSNHTTPTRTGRGIVVPGIDTSSIHDQNPDSTHNSFNGWPLTPPSAAAQDSRRPSNACSLQSEHSGPSSISSFSQPPTPVHSMVNSTEDFGHWSDSADMAAAIPGHLPSTCALPMYSAAFATHGLPNSASKMSMQMSTTSPIRNDAWQPEPFGATAQHGFTQGLDEHVASQSMYGNPSTSIVGSLDHSSFSEYNTSTYTGGSFSQLPPTVVPSELGPQDFPMEHYDYSQNDDMVHGFGESFTSNGSHHSDYQYVGPESPDDAYMVTTDDNYVFVKEELMKTPSRSSESTYRGSRASESTYRGHQQSPVQRRHSKKVRKSIASGREFGKYSTPHFDVRLEGKPFSLRFDAVTGRAVTLPQGPSNGKPHKCRVTDEDGQPVKDKDGNACSARFDRAEHLKRHELSHTAARPFPCVLAPCKARMGRSDNAADHYRTHLRPHSKSRNPYVTFEKLERAMRAHPAYSGENHLKATKLLNNLRRKMDHVEGALCADMEEKTRGLFRD